MKKKYIYLSLLSIFFIVSCSSVPKPIKSQFSTQKKLEASQHWEVLVKDFTKQVTTVMQEKELSIDLPHIYVQTNDISDFGKSFRSYLITKLSNLGYTISYMPENALMLRWSVQKTYHNTDRIASGFPGSNTTAFALGYGIYKVFDSSNTVFSRVLATGAALDFIDGSRDFATSSKVPHTEINLTFTVSKDAIILSRQSQAYYVNEQDFDHYANIPDYAGQESSLKLVNFKITD